MPGSAAGEVEQRHTPQPEGDRAEDRECAQAKRQHYEGAGEPGGGGPGATPREHEREDRQDDREPERQPHDSLGCHRGAERLEDARHEVGLAGAVEGLEVAARDQALRDELRICDERPLVHLGPGAAEGGAEQQRHDGGESDRHGHRGPVGQAVLRHRRIQAPKGIRRRIEH